MLPDGRRYKPQVNLRVLNPLAKVLLSCLPHHGEVGGPFEHVLGEALLGEAGLALGRQLAEAVGVAATMAALGYPGDLLSNRTR